MQPIIKQPLKPSLVARPQSAQRTKRKHPHVLTHLLFTTLPSKGAVLCRSQPAIDNRRIGGSTWHTSCSQRNIVFTTFVRGTQQIALGNINSVNNWFFLHIVKKISVNEIASASYHVIHVNTTRERLLVYRSSRTVSAMPIGYTRSWLARTIARAPARIADPMP